jgi:hypothetical protein
MPLANLPGCLVSGDESITNESMEPLGETAPKLLSEGGGWPITDLS